MRALALLFLAFAAAPAGARTVDSADHASFLRDGRLFRFDYANDFFAARDRYFTQGYGFTLFHPALAKSPVFRVLPALAEDAAFGLVFRNSGFTPTSLTSDRALTGDRPFACYLYLGHVLVSRNAGRALTLTAEFDAGIVGQGAGGKWIQEGLHRALGNQRPHGWDNQIRNDAVLDYSARLEKRAARLGPMDAGIYADARAGTLYTNASAGVELRAGRAAYLFARAEEKIVGYDATLQGGVFNRGSPYTLRAAEIERAVGRVDVGIAWLRDGFSLAFTRSFQSRELKSGLSHQWGELSLAWKL